MLLSSGRKGCFIFRRFWVQISTRRQVIVTSFVDFQIPFRQMLHLYPRSVHCPFCIFPISSLINHISRRRTVLNYWRCRWITKNSTESSSDAKSCSTPQEIPSILWNMNLHYSVDRCPPLVLFLSHMNVLATCFHAGFLLNLFFDPEDGGDMFLRNVGWHSTDYTALYPRWYSF
jgi:hypothetical protein